jgi:hypothetical protein
VLSRESGWPVFVEVPRLGGLLTTNLSTSTLAAPPAGVNDGRMTSQARLPVVALWLAAATIVTTPFLQVLSIVPGLASLVLGVLAYRRTRTAAPAVQTRGGQALAAGILALLAGLGILAIALIVSGTAIFTG